jgi:hypothetical protein
LQLLLPLLRISKLADMLVWNFICLYYGLYGLVLRIKQPGLERTFKVPALPVIAFVVFFDQYVLND